MKIPSLAGFFFCAYFLNFQHLCMVMNRLIICSFILCQHCFCDGQNQNPTAVWRVGLTHEFQKFNQLSSVRIQLENNKKMFAVNLGFSPQKAVQNIFAPALTLDFARLVKIHHVFLGPVMQFSIETYVFGTRFTYLNASVGYRFALGEQWQIFQETTFGPTRETFTYLDKKNLQFTWNYHVKLGLQYALR